MSSRVRRVRRRHLRLDGPFHHTRTSATPWFWFANLWTSNSLPFPPSLWSRTYASPTLIWSTWIFIYSVISSVGVGGGARPRHDALPGVGPAARRGRLGSARLGDEVPPGTRAAPPVTWHDTTGTSLVVHVVGPRPGPGTAAPRPDSPGLSGETCDRGAARRRMASGAGTRPGRSRPTGAFRPDPHTSVPRTVTT